MQLHGLRRACDRVDRQGPDRSAGQVGGLPCSHGGRGVPRISAPWSGLWTAPGARRRSVPSSTQVRLTYEVKVVTMPGDAPRRLLREQAMRAMGSEAADVLMEHLPPAGWADLARRSDVEHETALLRLEIGTLRRR